MTGSKRTLDSKVMILSLIIIIFSLCVSLYPRISFNGSGSGYDGTGDGESSFANASIESIVVEGAGFYLQANTCIQSFLNQVEISHRGHRGHRDFFIFLCALCDLCG